jgi:hypothetical protein
MSEVFGDIQKIANYTQKYINNNSIRRGQDGHATKNIVFPYIGTNLLARYENGGATTEVF